MSFTEHYFLQEKFKPGRDERFLALAVGDKTWEKFIKEITNVWRENRLDEPLTFVITDKTGNFVMHLKWEKDSNGYSYSLEESTVEWLKRNELTTPKTKLGFYYDVAKKTFVLDRTGENYTLPKFFLENDLLEFLNNLYFMNRYSTIKNKISIIYILYYIDRLSKHDSQKIKNNKFTPSWIPYTLKDDNMRGSGGLFGLFK